MDLGTRTSTPTPLTRSVPLKKLLGGRGLTRALLLLAVTTTEAAPLHGATPTSSTAAAATSATAATASSPAPTATAAAASASTAATEAPTPATTPTATPSPFAASTATSTALASSSSALVPLALAGAASPAKGRRSADRLGANEVDGSSKGNRGQKGGGGASLKEGGTRVTTRGSYSDYTLLNCQEALLEDVNELSRKRGAVAGVTSAKVRDEVSDSGKGGEVREQVRQHEAAKGSSGRGRVACNYSIIQGLSTLVLTKVRALSGRQVTTHSKTGSRIACVPLGANTAVSSGNRGRRGAIREIEH
ncbi:unnamed protein product [Closterium sp. NIES-64]|nr:unnamed protein product [Closterium sp. NIES-64]